MTCLYALLSTFLTWRHRERPHRQRTPTRVAFRRPWPGTRRGLCLWIFSAGIILVGGVNYATTELPERTRQSLTFPLMLTGGSAVPWGVAMIVVGAGAMFSSYCHFGRDRYGYVAIAVFFTGWGLAFMTGLLYGAGVRTVGSAVIWLIFAALAVVIAGFPNVRLNQPPITLAPDTDSEGVA